MALLLASRQIESEAYPLFYSLSTFILDGGAINDLLFLSALPQRYRSSLRNIVITAPTDPFSGRPWRLESRPQSFDSPIPIFTAFAAYMHSSLPVLEEVAIEYQPRGYENAHKELIKLLRLDRIKSLKFLITGCSRKDVLKHHSSSELRYRQLLPGFMLDPMKVAAQEYAFSRPRHRRELMGEKPWSAELGDWLRRKDRKVVRWRWADRDIDFGGCCAWQALDVSNRRIRGYGDIQAVVEFFVEDRSTL